MVLPDGNISFPLIGTLHAKGYTTEELSKKIATRLTSVFKKRPTVSVIVRSIGNNFFYIMGAVGKSGIVPFTHNIKLLQAIILAGGTTLAAKDEAIVLIRHNKPRTISIENLEKGRISKTISPSILRTSSSFRSGPTRFFIWERYRRREPITMKKKMTIMKAL
ncbi:polysaccharide export protein, partial [mine drainage metagenome]